MTAPAPDAAPLGEALPTVVDTLAARVIAIYATAEQELLAQLATIARTGMRDQAGIGQAAMLGRMQDAARRLAVALRLGATPLARQVTTEAAQHGDTAAARLLQRTVAGSAALARTYLTRIGNTSGTGIAAANAIAVDLAGKLDGVNQQIVRFADDAYRAATVESTTRLILGRENLTPATAQRAAWSELTRIGVTGYTDTAGHSWNLSSYVEVASRSATQRAFNAAHEARMTAVGIDYFTVARNGHPCKLCLPFEGAIISAHGAGRVTDTDRLTGRPVTFEVTCTVDEARARGLFHPNCRHVLVPYLPGVTKLAPVRQWSDADQERYDATQKLRRLERAVRTAKREQLGALDDLARLRAGRRVRALQAEIRAHVAQHDLVRRSRREQLDLGNR